MLSKTSHYITISCYKWSCALICDSIMSKRSTIINNSLALLGCSYFDDYQYYLGEKKKLIVTVFPESWGRWFMYYSSS